MLTCEFGLSLSLLCVSTSKSLYPVLIIHTKWVGKNLEQLLRVAIPVLGVPVLMASYKLYVLWAVPASHPGHTERSLSAF